MHSSQPLSQKGTKLTLKVGVPLVVAGTAVPARRLLGVGVTGLHCWVRRSTARLSSMLDEFGLLVGAVLGVRGVASPLVVRETTVVPVEDTDGGT